jgi:hypothetical protein
LQFYQHEKLQNKTITAAIMGGQYRRNGIDDINGWGQYCRNGSDDINGWSVLPVWQ